MILLVAVSFIPTGQPHANLKILFLPSVNLYQLRIPNFERVWLSKDNLHTYSSRLRSFINIFNLPYHPLEAMLRYNERGLDQK